LIGRKNVDPAPDIVLGSLGIKAQHAEILNEEGKISICPCDVRIFQCNRVLIIFFIEGMWGTIVC